MHPFPPPQHRTALGETEARRGEAQMGALPPAHHLSDTGSNGQELGEAAGCGAVCQERGRNVVCVGVCGVGVVRRSRHARAAVTVCNAAFAAAVHAPWAHLSVHLYARDRTPCPRPTACDGVSAGVAWARGSR